MKKIFLVEIDDVLGEKGIDANVLLASLVTSSHYDKQAIKGVQDLTEQVEALMDNPKVPPEVILETISDEEIENQVAATLARAYWNGSKEKEDIGTWEEYINASLINWLAAARGIIQLARQGGENKLKEENNDDGE